MAVPRNGSRPHASLNLESDAPSTQSGWVFDAPCGDMPGAFDIPNDVLNNAGALEMWAHPLLAVCAPCKFKQQCIELVDPAGSRNNTIAGGVVWRKGRRVTFGRSHAERDPRGAKPTKPCGTMAAYRSHLVWEEQPCEPCIAAMKADGAARLRRFKERAS